MCTDSGDGRTRNRAKFYQGWVREVIDAHKEIDNLCMSVANGQPPAAKYVNLENKISKNYVKKLEPLWYLTG